AVRSLAVVWGELIDQLRHPDPPLNRRIVFEHELGSPLHAELARDSRLQNRVRGLETGQCPLALPLGAEDRNEDARVPQVGGGLDAGDSDKSDPGVLQLPYSLGHGLPERLVHAAHAIRHTRYSTGCTPSFSPRLGSGASPPRSWAGSWASSSATSACR